MRQELSQFGWDQPSNTKNVSDKTFIYREKPVRKIFLNFSITILSFTSVRFYFFNVDRIVKNRLWDFEHSKTRFFQNENPSKT